ncbi:expressed unknown protein [Seminavis robusta]|uniref:Uncharacterized protein n=1 Tax=Seminavis robusta TaxID=568900 RepID=A0A9N8E7V8_9STRA|nr:expressed unknown protein [Seminavis robusta]|eukprot:Sro748_g196700.1 n/a (440) ;mRNA; f:23372-24691
MFRSMSLKNLLSSKASGRASGGSLIGRHTINSTGNRNVPVRSLVSVAQPSTNAGDPFFGQQHPWIHVVGGLAAAALAATTADSRSSSRCEQADNAIEDDEPSPLLRLLVENDDTNPLWPGGCREEDVDAFVDQVLQDPTINVAGIPDVAERIVYKSTVRLVLNTFYFLLSKLHGFALLDHEVVLHLERTAAETPVPTLEWKNNTNHNQTIGSSNLKVEASVDEHVLEQVADQLLANAAVNTTLLPDALERPLYVNSLRLVFRLLDILTSSFHLKVCGHVLLMDLAPLHDDEGKRSSSLSSSLTRIDLDKVREVARRHAGIHDDGYTSELSFFQRYSIRREFLAQLHASIYALLLGIADDILANAEITLLSDKIVLDVIPQRSAAAARKAVKKQTINVAAGKNKDSSDSGNVVDGGSFLLGCGVGAMTVAVAMALGQRGR